MHRSQIHFHKVSADNVRKKPKMPLPYELDTSLQCYNEQNQDMERRL